MRWKTTRAQGRKEYRSPWWMAFDSARALHKEETLKLLEAAYREHAPRLIFLQNEPEFDFLHNEPRYQALVKQVGLTPLP